ncbi:MAG: 4-coumarate--CoA ligase [Pseudomonadota bacterium]
MAITNDAIRRILISLIADAQAALIRKGAICQEYDINLQVVDQTPAQIDKLAIDETSLGFDSLSRLDLVAMVNQFFNLHTSGVEDYLLVKRRLGDWVDLVAQHFALCRNDISLSFQTSGSTAAPKLVTHSLWSLQAEINACCKDGILAPGSDTRVLSLVPPHHIYGFLFSCLLPSIKDLQVLALHRHPPTSVFAKARPGDLIVATPYIWDRLAETTLEFQSGIHGITSAGPSSTKTWSVMDTAGLSSLTEIYGATETAGVGYRTSSRQTFQLLPHLIRRGGQVHRRGMRGPALQLQDRLHWSGQHTFSVKGRCDDAVQIGGVNVSPTHVARTINELSGVKTAYIRFDGNRLHAFIVPANQQDITDGFKKAVHAHIRRNLDPVARPSDIVYGTAPLRDNMGKLRDWTVEHTAQ